MAADTVAGNFGMVKNGADEGSGIVAGVALRAGLDVVRAHSKRVGTVVTAVAAALYLGVIDEAYSLPQFRYVATLTVLGARDVRGWLGGSRYQGAVVVAACAIAGCALELALHVARFTGHDAVRAIQVEAGFHVLKGGERWCGTGQQQRDSQKDSEYL